MSEVKSAEPTVEEVAAIFGYELKRRPLSTAEATELCCFKSIETLATMRQRGRGPRYFRQDKHVLYSEVDLLRWLYAGMASNTSQYPTHQNPDRRTSNASGDTSVRPLEAVQK